MTETRDYNYDSQFLAERIEELLEKFYFRSISDAKIKKCIDLFIAENMAGVEVEKKMYVKEKAVKIVKANMDRIYNILLTHTRKK